MIVGSKNSARGPVQPQPETVKQMRAAAELAAEYVEDYLGLMREGWAPDLQEFLESVPERLREEVFCQLDRALANRGEEATDPHLEPQAEIVVDPVPIEKPTPPSRGTPSPATRPALHQGVDDDTVRTEGETGTPAQATPPPESAARRLPVDPDLWVRALCLLVPGDLRYQFVGELRAERAEQRQRGDARLDRTLHAVRKILTGYAQHAPLETAGDKVREPVARRRNAARAGWVAWRAFGPALALGLLAGSLALVLVAGGLLGTAFGCLVVAARPPLRVRQVRLINAALGGTVAALGVILLLGLVSGAGIGLGALLGWTWLSAVSVKLLAWGAVAVTAAISGSGWTPRAWTPTRLIRI